MQQSTIEPLRSQLLIAILSSRLSTNGICIFRSNCRHMVLILKEAYMYCVHSNHLIRISKSYSPYDPIGCQQMVIVLSRNPLGWDILSCREVKMAALCNSLVST